MKKNFVFGKHPSIFLVAYLNRVYINLTFFLSIFSPSIENLKKHMILALLLFNVPFWLYIYIYIYEKTSLLISLCILRDLLQQKIPRDLGKIPLYLYVPMFP